MIKILLVPSSDYLGHPFLQRHNQIFERLDDQRNFEVHVTRFVLFDKVMTDSKVIIHELKGRERADLATYYLFNAMSHAAQIKNIVRKENIDVLVLSNLAAPFVYMLMNQLSRLNVPVIVDLPDYFPTSAAGYLSNFSSTIGSFASSTFNIMLRFMLKRASMVTAASKALVDYSRLSGAKHVSHVPNGIASCFLKVHNGRFLRDELGLTEDVLIAGYIGSMEFWLQMKPLIKSIALAKREGINVNLLLVGGTLHTNFAERLNRIIRDEGIEKCVKQLDFVPYEKVPEYIACFDVGLIPFNVLNPTAYYAAPNKLWEYLSQKKPVIATPIPEIIMNADCVFTANSTEDYVRQFLKIAGQNPEVLLKTNLGHKRAQGMTWDNSAKLFGSCVCSLLGQAS